MVRLTDGDDGSILFIGTATVLLRYGGFTVLTDPNFIHRHERIHLGYGMHTRRLTDPALEMSELPPLDLVVLSHLHEDHFDRVAETELARTTAHAAEHLARKGCRPRRSRSRLDATWHRGQHLESFGRDSATPCVTSGPRRVRRGRRRAARGAAVA